jgi:hypothetical protein
MKFPKIINSPERRSQLGLVLFCVLTALEGIVISILFNKMTGQTGGFLAGFSIKRMFIPIGMLLLSVGLLILGWFAIFRPRYSEKWIVWLKRPLQFRIGSYGTALTFFLSWVAVLGWNGTLDRMFARYLPVYERIYPILLWALFISIQAGLFLFLLSLPESGSARETISPELEKRKPILEVLAVLIPLLLYSILIQLAVPRPIGEIFRYDLRFFSLPAMVILYFAFRKSGWKSNLIGLSAVLAMAGFALSYLWNSGASEEPVVMGLFPYLDPSGYYSDALRILAGQLMENGGGRPLFAGFLSMVLGITGNNLQISLAILVAITTISCYIAAREIGRNFGPAAAAFSMLLMFIYYRQFMGTTYSENLGLPLSALGLAFLLQGARLKNFLITLVGMFLTSFALNTRPGPFFVLPFLALWFAWVFRGSNTLRSWVRPFIIGCGAILLAFFFNYLMDRVLSTPNYAVFSRFPLTFYGLTVGGKNWNQVNIDHPELLKLTDPQLSQTIYAISFENIRSNPGRFINGLWKIGLDFFSVDSGAFTFIYGDTQIRLGLFILGLFGLGLLIARPKNIIHVMLLACFLGIVLSAPFVPARDSNRMRTYAAVIPFIVIIPALCFSLPGLWTRIIPSQNTAGAVVPYRSFDFIFTALLIFCAVAGPYLAKAFSPKPNFQTSSCAAPNQPFYIRINPGSFVDIVADSEKPETHLPELRLGDLTHSINDFAYRLTFNQQPYRPGTSITVTIDLLTGTKIWADIPTAGLPADGSIVKICGRSVPHYYSIYADSFDVVGK